MTGKGEGCFWSHLATRPNGCPRTVYPEFYLATSPPGPPWLWVSFERLAVNEATEQVQGQSEMG